MKFKNITTGKENVKYRSGEVLILYNESVGKSEAYMVVICGYASYNIIDLNSGKAYYNDCEDYDDFVRKLGQIFVLIERIDNNELELVRVED